MVFSFVLLFGCQLNKSVKAPDFIPAKTPDPFFSKDSLYSYSGNIDLYGRNISGNLLIKRTSSTKAKLVFTHESGFQLMAFSFSEGKMSTHFVHDNLDKKLVLRVIERDLRTLFFEAQCETAVKEKDQSTVFCRKGKTEYQLQINEDEKVEKIFVRTGKKSELTVNFVAVEDDVPDTIRIDHHDIKLNYRFYRIRK